MTYEQASDKNSTGKKAQSKKLESVSSGKTLGGEIQWTLLNEAAVIH